MRLASRTLRGRRFRLPVVLAVAIAGALVYALSACSRSASPIATVSATAYRAPGGPVAGSAASSVHAEEQPAEPGQTFVLSDYRWVPVSIKRTPTAIGCHFSVVSGAPTVRLELLSERDFFLFARRREYESLAATATGGSGGFERMIATPGLYRVLIRNERGAPPVRVSLSVRTEADPLPFAISREVPPGRRLAVVAISLSVFFAIVFWSGRMLLRARRNR